MIEAIALLTIAMVMAPLIQLAILKKVRKDQADFIQRLRDVHKTEQIQQLDKF